MLQTGNSGTKNAQVAGFARGLGAGSTTSQHDVLKGTADRPMTSTKHHGALLATFAISLIAPVVYFVAAVAGWIDWAAGLPAAIVALFLAWTSAIRINERTRSASP